MTIRFSARTLLTALACLSMGLPVLAQSTDAEVRKVDRDQGKLTLRHAEIKNLEMPAMTMVFRVANAQLLDGLVEGSKVKFDAEKVNGQYTVVRLVLVP